MKFLLILNFYFFGSTFGKECCPQNTYPLRSMICSDNVTKLNLKCPNKLFVVNPNEDEADKFEITETGDLRLVEGSLKVSPSE